MWQWLTDKRLWLLTACLAGTLFVLQLSSPAVAVPDASQLTPTPSPFLAQDSASANAAGAELDLNGFGQMVGEIAPVMLLAALLGGLMAYRRRMTVFEHNLFHAHILLSVAGALMMLIVGNQLARAFGLLGAASVVRYRYGLRNPRDASLLIISLGIGMATGVGLYVLAVSAAGVVFVFSRGLDILTGHTEALTVVTRPTRLQVRTIYPTETMARLDQVFRERDIQARLRRYRQMRKKNFRGQPVLVLEYTVRLGPHDSRSQLTSQLAGEGIIEIRWKMEKPQKG